MLELQMCFVMTSEKAFEIFEINAEIEIKTHFKKVSKSIKTKK